MANEPAVSTDEDQAGVDACNALEPGSCVTGDFVGIGAGLSDAARHKIRLILAWIKAHSG